MEEKNILDVWALVAAALIVCLAEDTDRLEDGQRLCIAAELLDEAETILSRGMNTGRWH